MEKQISLQTQPLIEHFRSGNTCIGINIDSEPSSRSEAILTHRRLGCASETEDALLQNVVVLCNFGPQLPQQILFHLLEHIFDSVLVKLPPSTQRRIIHELWTLVPPDILNLKSALDRWTKQGVWEVYNKAQESCSLFSSEALNAIVNSKTEPFLTDVAIHFIEHYYYDVAHISKAVNRILDSAPYQRNLFNYQTISRQTIGITKQFTSPRFSYNSREEKVTQRFTAPHLKKRLLLCLLVTIVIIGASCYGTYLICSRNTNPSLIEMLPLSESTSPTPNVSTTSGYQPPIPPEEPIHRGPHYLNVKSYADYKSAIFKLMNDHEIHLVMSLENDEDWPDNFSMGDTHMIKKLKIIGGSSIPKILEILSVMLNTENITITNNTSLLCPSYPKTHDTNRKTITLSHVKYFALENITECSHFYNAISETIIFNRMYSFQIFNGVFTDQNIKFIKKILINSSDHLKSIEFPGGRWYTLLFDRFFGTYRAVEVLKIDFRGNESITHLHRNICNAFPNMKKFYSAGGFVEWKHFNNLSQCRSLMYVKIGLQTHNTNGSIDLRPVQANFHELQSLEVTLNFAMFNNMSGCKIIGLQEIERYLAYFKYRSNCNIDKRIK